MAKPWERREKESAQAFEAFALYRDMGAERSLDAVCQRVAKSLPLLKRWSARDAWVERARAFDEHIATEDAKKAAAKRLKELEEMRERHRVAGRLAMARAMNALAKENDGVPVVQAETAVDVYRLAKTGLMLEQSGHALTAGTAKTSGDDRAGPGSPAEDLPRLTKLEVEIIGDGGQRISIDDIASKLRAFYDEPTK